MICCRRVTYNGPFSKLIDRTGPEVSSHLRSVAMGKRMHLKALLSMKEEAD